jgi:hypothetical protein
MVAFILLDAATTQPEQFYNSPWFTLVVGTICLIIGWKVSFTSIRYAAKLDADRERERRMDELRIKNENAAESLRARRIALNAELDYILETIAEGRKELKKPSTFIKGLNLDFLQASRLDWYKADSDAVFIKALAAAYRDVVLANQQLSDHVNWWRSLTDRVNLDLLHKGAELPLASLEGVEGSITALKKLTEEKLASVPADPPPRAP